MCGITGVYLKNPTTSNAEEYLNNRVYEEMLETLRFRGPDEQQIVRMGAAILGHTRLSIIDLTTGTQPIFNEDRQVAVVLNGEIYNFPELKRELEARGHIFKTRSDTEVVVHLYEEVGESVFSYLNGMFAILIYDKRTHVIIGARDRTGEKPLVYCETPESFLFASEIKAILKYPGISRDIDLEGLALYFNSLAVTAPYTIFRQIRKLPPAHFFRVEGGQLEIKRYWEPRIEIKWDMDENVLNESFKALFSDAVRMRTIADVPLGVFLSGGIDSSAVVAFMAQHCPGQVKTFTVGFRDEIDERPYARIVAELYQTEHTELFIDKKLEDAVLDVLRYYDEPFGDSSAVPTHLVAREARKHVKVILTGDGGDELFAGYDAYLNQKYQLFDRFSSRLYKEIGKLTLNILKKDISSFFYPRRSWPYAFDHWHRLKSFFLESEIRDLIPLTEGFVRDFFHDHHWLNLFQDDALSLSYAFDMNYYLPDDLLKKVDMASMLTSLECRAPFLDHRLIEFSFTIPPQLKVKNDVLKYVLKNSLDGYLPPEILYRSKTGFGAPVDSWLRNQLKDLVQSHLAPGCKIESIIPRRMIMKTLRDVYEVPNCPDYRLPYKLWLLFVLEIWMQEYC